MNPFLSRCGMGLIIASFSGIPSIPILVSSALSKRYVCNLNTHGLCGLFYHFCSFDILFHQNFHLSEHVLSATLMLKPCGVI